MSRSIKAIFDSMITEKETFSSLDTLVPKPDTAQTFLDDLTTGSKVAIWRLFLWVIAVAIFTHESLFDQHVIDVEARAKEIIPGVLRYYVVEAKKFQNGDALTFDGSKFVYLDTTSAAAVAKQIISQASAIEANQIVTLKVAKTVATVLQKLTTAEKTSFEAYLDQYKIAGTKTLVITDDADFIKIAYTIEYDPQVIDSTGLLISDGTTKPIQVAIDAYIEWLPFDNIFRVLDLTDAVQAAQGVVNAVCDVAEATHGALAYTLILDDIEQDYLPNAGYLASVDETGSETTPVFGDINVLTPLDHSASTVYAVGDFVRFNDGGSNIVYKCNVIIDPGEAFDATKFDTVSNLTFISI